MAHFAELDKNNVVLRVLVVADKDTSDDKGVEKENIGVAYLQKLFGADTHWVQTSYNNKIKKQYASVNGTYDADLNAFIPPKPDKWHVWNEETWTWDTPIPAPDTSKFIVMWNSLEGKWDTKPIIE